MFFINFLYKFSLRLLGIAFNIENTTKKLIPLSNKSVNICVENTDVIILTPEFFKTATIILEPDEVTPLNTIAVITEAVIDPKTVINIIDKIDFIPSNLPLLNNNPVLTPITSCTGINKNDIGSNVAPLTRDVNIPTIPPDIGPNVTADIIVPIVSMYTGNFNDSAIKPPKIFITIHNAINTIILTLNFFISYRLLSYYISYLTYYLKY